MKVTEVRTAVVSPVMDAVRALYPNAVQIGKQSFAVPVEVDGQVRYAGIDVTCKDFTGTKSRSPFTLDVAVEKFNEEQEEARLKALEKAQEKERKTQEHKNKKEKEDE